MRVAQAGKACEDVALQALPSHIHIALSVQKTISVYNTKELKQNKTKIKEIFKNVRIV